MDGAGQHKISRGVRYNKPALGFQEHKDAGDDQGVLFVSENGLNKICAHDEAITASYLHKVLCVWRRSPPRRIAFCHFAARL